MSTDRSNNQSQRLITTQLHVITHTWFSYSIMALGVPSGEGTPSVVSVFSDGPLMNRTVGQLASLGLQGLKLVDIGRYQSTMLIVETNLNAYENKLRHIHFRTSSRPLNIIIMRDCCFEASLTPKLLILTEISAMVSPRLGWLSRSLVNASEKPRVRLRLCPWDGPLGPICDSRSVAEACMVAAIKS